MLSNPPAYSYKSISVGVYVNELAPNDELTNNTIMSVKVTQIDRRRGIKSTKGGLDRHLLKLGVVDNSIKCLPAAPPINYDRFAVREIIYQLNWCS